MRLFIGITLSDVIRTSLCKICRELKEYSSQMKWVNEDNIHITLKFLGETDKKDKIIDILENKISSSGFTLDFSGIGKFGRGDELRILWAGIKKSEGLNTLFDEIESLLEPIGFPKEKRKFSPHVTLARSRYGRMGKEFMDRVDGLSGHFFGKQEVTSFRLFKSTLTLSGPVYSVLKEISLKS